MRQLLYSRTKKVKDSALGCSRAGSPCHGEGTVASVGLFSFASNCRSPEFGSGAGEEASKLQTQHPTFRFYLTHKAEPLYLNRQKRDFLSPYL